MVKYRHEDNNGNTDTDYEFWYDIDGERIGKCRRSLSSTETEEFTFYLRDEEGNVMTEFKSDFCPSPQYYELSNNAFSAKENNFYFGGKLFSTEKVDSYQSSCPVWHFYHSDHLGTPRVITDEQGNIISEHKYFPYGEEITPQSKDTLSHRFTGQERDFESNLDYMHARYYNNFIGRFLSLDIRKGTKFEPKTLNRYTYSENNPLYYVDSNGKEPISIATVAAIGSAFSLIFNTAKQIKEQSGMGYLKQLTDIQGAYLKYKELCDQGKISGKSQVISTIEGAASAAGGSVVGGAKSLIVKYGGSFLIGTSVNAMGQAVDDPNKNVDMKQAGTAGFFNTIGTFIGDMMQNAANSLASKAASAAATDANIMSQPWGDVPQTPGADLSRLTEGLIVQIKVEAPTFAQATIQGVGQAVANSTPQPEQEQNK